MKTSFKTIITTSIIGLSLVATNAFAQTTITTTKTNHAASLVTKEVGTADNEIANRITSLNDLQTKIQNATKVSSSTKMTISSTVESEITNLTALKSKIDADTDATTLKADVKSITASYRIYALIEPQIEILATADKIDSLAELVSTVSNKVQILLTSLSAKGIDTSTMETTLANENAKVTDANTQAQAAITRTSGLIPDNGDTTVAASNKSALQQSRADIRVGVLDLHTAKTDLDALIKQIRQMEPKTTATSTPISTSTVSQ